MKYSFDSSVATTIVASEYNAEIDIGGTVIKLRRNKPFTKRQIKHIRNYFGFEAKNL